jgi:hypothetical protein
VELSLGPSADAERYGLGPVTFCEISYLEAILYLLNLSIVSMVKENNFNRLSEKQGAAG